MTSFGNTIIALLGAGLGDRAIAQHLGIGLRTIQRRIHDIMSRLNTVTHFKPLLWQVEIPAANVPAQLPDPVGEIGGDPVEVSWNGDFVTLRFDLIDEASAYLTENARIPAGEKLVILRGLVSATGTAPIDKQMFDYLDVVDDRGMRVLDALDNFVELRDCPQPDAVPAGETKLVCAAYLTGVGTPIAGFALSIEADQPETWSYWRNT